MNDTERDEIIRTMWATHTWVQIAEAVGRSPTWVSTRVSEVLGLPSKRKKIDRNELAKLWADESLTVEQIGERLGISRAKCSKHAQKLGLPRRATDPTTLSVIAAIEEYNKGLPLRVILRDMRKTLPKLAEGTLRAAMRRRGCVFRGRGSRRVRTMNEARHCAKLHRLGATPQEIAERLGVDRRKVSRRLRVLGVVSPHPYKVDPAKIVKAYRRLGCKAHVAAELGIDVALVWYHCKRAGLTQPKRQKAVAS